MPALGKRPALAEGFDVPLQAPATRLVLWFEGLEVGTSLFKPCDTSQMYP